MNILYLYPDLLNLHGDKGNILAFEKIGKLMKVNIKVDRLDDFKEKIDFSKYDLIFISPGELVVIKEVVKNLKKQKEELLKFLDNDKYIICIGSSAALFADKINIDDSFEGLGIGNFDVISRENIFGDDLIFDFNKHQVVGSQIQVVDILPKENNTLGKTTYGYGNDGKTEGIRYHNLIITNALGPVFIKNPWLVEEIIKDILKNKKLEYSKINYDLEKLSNKEILEFNLMK